MRLPNFLIVGAMKAGTTTLYRDLLTNPRVFFPIDKEPQSLTTEEVETENGLREYSLLFDKASADQVAGEASTGYTRLPGTPGVAARARRLLGPDLRVIYLVREPVARTLSHHRHDFSYGRVDPDVNRVVRECPDYLDTSRYAMQIGPWIEAFGADHVRILRFEDYIGNRPETVAGLSTFLGVEPRPERVEAGRVFNRAEDRRALIGPFAVFQRSALYRRLIRPLLPIPLKDRLRDSLLPRDTRQPQPVTVDTVAYIIEALRDDMERLRVLMRRDAPVWDETSVRARHASSADVAGV